MKNIFLNDNKQIRSGWKIIIAVLCIAISMPLWGILKALFIPFTAFLSDTAVFRLHGCIQELIIILIIIALWKLIDKKSLTQLGLPTIRNNKKNFIYGLIAGALSLTVVSIILVCTNSAVISGNLSNPNFSIEIFGAFIFYIFVGFNEEIVFRGYFLSVLKQCKNKYVPYIGSAILFALAHSLNPGISILAYINLFLFGLSLSYVIYKTKNIWFGIGMHITWNFFEGNVWGFLVSGGNDTQSIYTLKVLNSNIINGGNFGPEGGLAVTVVLVVLILLVYKFVPQKAE